MVNAIHRINRYPLDSLVCFTNTYPLDSDLFGGYAIHPLNNWGLVVAQTGFDTKILQIEAMFLYFFHVQA